MNQRATFLFAMEGASTAPTAWEMSQIEILSSKIPPATEEVRKLVSDDLAALNAMMLEAKIPHILPPQMPGAGGRRAEAEEFEDQ